MGDCLSETETTKTWGYHLSGFLAYRNSKHALGPYPRNFSCYLNATFITNLYILLGWFQSMNLDWPHLEISMVAKANAFLSKELKKILDSQHFIFEKLIFPFLPTEFQNWIFSSMCVVSFQKWYLQEYIRPVVVESEHGFLWFGPRNSHLQYCRRCQHIFANHVTLKQNKLKILMPLQLDNLKSSGKGKEFSWKAVYFFKTTMTYLADVGNWTNLSSDVLGLYRSIV